MTSNELVPIVNQARAKTLAAIKLVDASLKKLAPYDASRTYSPEEREPYDALSDRFVRAVEVCIKFFRSYELLQFAENSSTLRDQLNRMEKLGLVTSTELWFQMRDVRNRIVHDYLPAEIKDLYDDLLGPLGAELQKTAAVIAALPLEGIPDKP